MLTTTTKLWKSTTWSLTLVLPLSLIAPCLADGRPYDPRCDRFAISAGSTATTSFSASFIVSQNTISGEEIEVPPLDDRPGIVYLPLPPDLG